MGGQPDHVEGVDQPDGTRALEARDVRRLLTRLRDDLAARREELDELNVFPVPDADTGTNMLMTVREVLDELEAGDRDRTGPPESGSDSVPDAVARAALLSGRGNSGVILGLVIRAVAETVGESGALDAAGLAAALRRAREDAYEAVAEPVEGTILTALSTAADTAEELAGRFRRQARQATSADLPDGAEPAQPGLSAVTEALVAVVHDAVEHTPEQLDALAEAGVVDAGARGFEVFCGSLHTLVTGAAPAGEGGQPGPERTGPSETGAPAAAQGDRSAGRRETGLPAYRFEVQYLLAADDADIPSLRERLEQLGGSVVVAGRGGRVTVHVHTNDVGPAIEEGLSVGRPSRIQVTAFDDRDRSASDTARAPRDAHDSEPDGRGT